MMSLWYRVAKWAHSLSRAQRLIWSSFVSAGTFFAGAAGSIFVSQAAEFEWRYALLVVSASFFFLVFLVVFVGRVLVSGIEEIEAEEEKNKATIMQAHNLCDRLLAKREYAANPCDGVDSLKRYYKPSVELIQDIIDAAYDTFESTFGKSASSEQRVDFEVTFMSKSLKDGGITIPAAANRFGRMPRSLIERKDNPALYSQTETAKIYAMANPKLVIVSSTAGNNYAELYVGQKERIKSSIVYPVFSRSNDLLGTLVCHCDREGFFTEAKQKYWVDLMEVFAKRISQELLRNRCLIIAAEKSFRFELNKDESAYF